MPAKRGTRTPHAPGQGEKPREVTRKLTALRLWPGINEPWCPDGNCCTWAVFNGSYQIKLINRLCPAHGRYSR